MPDTEILVGRVEALTAAVEEYAAHAQELADALRVSRRRFQVFAPLVALAVVVAGLGVWLGFRASAEGRATHLLCQRLVYAERVSVIADQRQIAVSRPLIKKLRKEKPSQKIAGLDITVKEDLADYDTSVAAINARDKALRAIGCSGL